MQLRHRIKGQAYIGRFFVASSSTQPQALSLQSGMQQPYGEKFTLDLVETDQFGNLVSCEGRHRGVGQCGSWIAAGATCCA